jgi:hypothetical protein
MHIEVLIVNVFKHLVLEGDEKFVYTSNCILIGMSLSILFLKVTRS